ncbi:uncharacterized protein ARMOST_14361 [Armillaria ostoyae]|uniref:Uncharacterized protein n=1 Tax=Armillaria ostoyae TaxID=47428 RepID=A0A284RQI9_ARMOS|nr:uncharacterized protein ARMOST_14361 [Armillaria ostoyae]
MSRGWGAHHKREAPTIGYLASLVKTIADGCTVRHLREAPVVSRFPTSNLWTTKNSAVSSGSMSFARDAGTHYTFAFSPVMRCPQDYELPLSCNHECHDDEDSQRRETPVQTTIMLGVHRASSGGICRANMPNRPHRSCQSGSRSAMSAAETEDTREDEKHPRTIIIWTPRFSPKERIQIYSERSTFKIRPSLTYTISTIPRPSFGVGVAPNSPHCSFSPSPLCALLNAAPSARKSFSFHQIVVVLRASALGRRSRLPPGRQAPGNPPEENEVHNAMK